MPHTWICFCHESCNSNEGRHLWGMEFWKLPLPHHAITNWWESQISQTRIFCFYLIIENIFVHPQVKFSIQTKGRVRVFIASKCPVTMNSIFKDVLSSGNMLEGLSKESQIWRPVLRAPQKSWSVYTRQVCLIWECLPGDLEKGRSTCHPYVVLNQRSSHPANIQRTMRTIWKCRWFSIQSQGRIWTRTLNVWPRIQGVFSHSIPQSKKVGIWGTRKENPACSMLYGCWIELHTDVSLRGVESKPQNVCERVCCTYMFMWVQRSMLDALCNCSPPYTFLRQSLPLNTEYIALARLTSQ